MRVLLSAYKTHGKVVLEARLRSYASMMFRLFCEELSAKQNYDSEVTYCLKTLGTNFFDVLKMLA